MDTLWHKKPGGNVITSYSIHYTKLYENLAKQLNILIADMGLPADQLITDPTTGALGYGIEYGYSSMERLRLAALQGDKMTQFPMILTVGAESYNFV